MDHPVLGKLEANEDGGWETMLVFPDFRAFYERWAPQGGEWNLERSLDDLAGRFRVELTPIFEDLPGRRGQAGPPSAAQVVAVEYLLENQGRMVEAIAEALAREAPSAFHWGMVLDELSEAVIPNLAIPSWIMQIVHLQSIIIGVQGEGGCADVGFSFHSEILEVEHGVAVIMHRDRALRVGTWDELDGLFAPSFDPDDEDDDEPEEEDD